MARSKRKEKTTLTQRDLQLMFGVSRQTLYKWRTRKKSPLPFTLVPDSALVRFDLSRTVRWATATGRRIKRKIYA
jgi:predicted DNA-binding transcriptional regulator AlpA